MEPDFVLKEIAELARARFLPIIGLAKGKYLTETVKKVHAKKVLEVGTLIGYSAILIARELPEDGHVTTIEINERNADLARENIQKARLSDRIEVKVGDALKELPKIKGEFDMIFLDATKEEYLDYLRLAEVKLRKGGAVFADNVKVSRQTLTDYLDYVRNSGKYKSEYIDTGFDGVEVSIKLF